jgi:hypothetical protein
MNYANILRFVLTSDSSSIDKVCPRRIERVEAVASVIPQVPVSTITLKKSLLDALADLEDEPEQTAAPIEAPAPVEEKKKVTDTTKVYSYFAKRLNWRV